MASDARVLPLAFDDMRASPDGTRLVLRPNCRLDEPLAQRRMSCLVLGPLAMLRRDRLAAQPTAAALAAGTPFVYPLELTFFVRESLARGPSGLAPALPPAVAAAARAGRALVLVWLGHEAMPLNLDADGRRWMFDAVQDLVTAHDLPPAHVWFVSGNVWGDRLFGAWLRDRRLYEPEVFRFRALATVPDSVQASYRANARGIALQAHEADDVWSFALAPLGADAFAQRYVTPGELASERRAGRLRAKRFLSFNRTLRLHRQVLVSYLAGRGLLDRSIVSFAAGAQPFFDLSDVSLAPQVVRDGWAQVQARLPLVADAIAPDADWHAIQDGAPYRESYFNLATETEVSSLCAPFSTEKVLKPMLNLQPIVLIATAETWRYLRAMGFKSFHRLVDEVYDQIPDPIDRLAHVFDQIDRLAGLTDAQARDAYFDCLPELEHNRAHLIDGRHALDELLDDIERALA